MVLAGKSRLSRIDRIGVSMAALSILDQTYSFVLNHFITTGRAPHFTDLAKEMGVSMEEGRQALKELMDLEIPGMWLHPGTDNIASFAPFSDFTTQYRITVKGEQKWFGQ